jgi:hypothetical protein
MLKFIYYTIINLAYYNKEREVEHSRLMEVAAARGVKGTQDAVTSVFLAKVGLKIVENDMDTVPWYIPLSRTQRRWIKTVSKYGYKVGLPF